MSRGTINTPMVRGFESGDAEKLDSLDVPLKREGRPEEVAELIAWLLSDASSYVTGSIYNIDGGMMS